jgi:transposase
VKENRPGNREIIVEHIETTYGVRYEISSISKLMKRLGLKKLRPRLVPGKPPALEKQVEFILRYHQIRDFEKLDEGLVQLFVDGAHLIHQVIPSLCWGDPSDPPFLQTNSSRQRLNILGAYHPVSQEFIHLTSEANCDASQVICFLEKVLSHYAHCHSIILNLDNAPYFHALLVQQWLEAHPQVILNPLPAYAPNLNLIERLWRFVKERLVHNRYYARYKTFRAFTFRLLNRIPTFSTQLKSLINDNFELVFGKFNA